MLAAKKYTTALAKGQGIIDETLALLGIWEPGMTSRQLSNLSSEWLDYLRHSEL